MAISRIRNKQISPTSEYERRAGCNEFPFEHLPPKVPHNVNQKDSLRGFISRETLFRKGKGKGKQEAHIGGDEDPDTS